MEWREALSGAENYNATRISTVRSQIAALGPVPEEGHEEAPEIAKRRAQLNDQLAKLQAPALEADEAYKRAVGLISEIDRVLRARQADELLRLWPTPVNPANWCIAVHWSRWVIGTIRSIPPSVSARHRVKIPACL